MDISDLENRVAAGDADALYELGCLYVGGPVATRNYEEAVQCFQAAIRLGSAEAINALGVCFLYGYGVKQNAFRAVTLFREAQAKGVARGIFDLGCCYFNGLGVEADLETGVELMLEAASKHEISESGDGTLDASLGALYFNGLASETGDWSIEPDHEKAVFYLQRAAEKENPLGMTLFGYCCLLNGTGVQADPIKASEYFQKALPYGLPLADTGWGICLLNGYAVKKNSKRNRKRAFAHFQKALQEGNLPGKYYSAWCLLDGTGTKKNTKQAVELLQQLMEETPTPEVGYLLGWCYQNGRGVKKTALKRPGFLMGRLLAEVPRPRSNGRNPFTTGTVWRKTGRKRKNGINTPSNIKPPGRRKKKNRCGLPVLQCSVCSGLPYL